MAKPLVIGLYGISYTGKCTIWNQLQAPSRLGNNDFKFYPGIDMLAMDPGTFAALQDMSEPQQKNWRERMVKGIGEECAQTGLTGITTGHAVLWNHDKPFPIYSAVEFETFTHILYLERSVDEMYDSQANDGMFHREYSREELRAWQQAEIADLQSVCLQQGVVFGRLKEETMLDKAHRIIQSIKTCTGDHNRTQVLKRLAEIMPIPQITPVRSVVVLDGDRILATGDTSKLFWQLWTEHIPFLRKPNQTPLQTIFTSRKMGYTFTAFQQAAILYETLDAADFDACCERVAAAVTINPTIKQLLSRATTFPNVEVVIVTTGLGQIWERILAREGLNNDYMSVLGSGLASQGYLITTEVKIAVVQALRSQHRARVWALGDSPLDLKMLRQAHMPIVVVGSEESRSREMLVAVECAVGSGLRAWQVVSVPGVAPLLDNYRLQLVPVRELLGRIVGRSGVEF